MSDVRTVSRLQDKLALGIGAALFVSPWVLQYTDLVGATENAWLCGVVIMGVAVAAILTFTRWQHWHGLILGLWIVITPWVLDFAAAIEPTIAHVLLGGLLLVCEGWEIWDVRHPKGLPA